MGKHVVAFFVFCWLVSSASAQTGYPTDTPAVNPPIMSAPAAWSPNTPYSAGQIVTNQGNAYVAYIAGTSGFFGGPTGTGFDRIQDGSVYWYFYGIGPSITNLTPSQPDPTDLTVSVFNSSSGPNPAFLYTGGVPYEFSPHSSGTDWIVQTGTAGANGLDIYSDAGMSFVSDAPKIELVGYSPEPYRLLIDGQYAFPGGETMQVSSNSGEGRIVVNWNGVARAHQYTLVENGTMGTAWFTGVKVGSVSVSGSGPTPYKVAAPVGIPVRACFFGDSTIAGADEANGTQNYPYPVIFPFVSGETWPSQVGQQLGWFDVWNLGVAGTGYLAYVGPPPPSSTSLPMYYHVTDATQHACNVVLIEAGHNDLVYSPNTTPPNIQPAALTAAAVQLLGAIRAGLPNAPIIVFGMWPGAEGTGPHGLYPPSSPQYETEAAIQAGYTQFGDPNTFFVPIVTDAQGSWFTGSGTTAVPNGTGNSDYYISGDATHPVQGGIDYMATRATAAIRAILPNVKGLE